MNVEYFDQIWRDKESKQGSYKEASQTSWDSRAEEFNSHETDERIGIVTKLLLSKQMLDENSTVLDIGCGPGKFVQEFARYAQNAVGLDSSPKMLAYARNNVASGGIENAEFVELDWEKADLTALKWKKRFSLVTAIMSPALNSRESLDKIIEASRGYGFLSHYVERHDSISDVLKKRIHNRETVDEYGNKAIYCSFNILWQYKLFPEIVYYKIDRENIRPLVEANRHYLTRLEAKAPLAPEQKTEILTFLKNSAENGMVRERITGKIACLFWKNR